MRITTLSVLAVLLAVGPSDVWAGQQRSVVNEVAVWKSMASTIPLGSRVKLQTTAGKRMTATLMNVGEEAIIVRRDTRVPETPMTVRFDELAQLERHQPGGLSVGKAVGIGLAAGAGAILAMFAIAFSLSD